jgi:hypothetical protein
MRFSPGKQPGKQPENQAKRLDGKRWTWQALLNRCRSPLQGWWEGKYIPAEPHPHIMMMGHIERHWTARCISAVWSYFKEHHRWIIGLSIGVALAIFVKR